MPSIARGTNSHDGRKLQLLLLHSASPLTDEDAEQFALRGNFTTEAATISKLEVWYSTVQYCRRLRVGSLTLRCLHGLVLFSALRAFTSESWGYFCYNRRDILTHSVLVLIIEGGCLFFIGGKLV